MENYYIASMCLTENIGCMRGKVLLEHFGSGKAIWLADNEELRKVELPSSVIEEFINFRRTYPNCPEQLVEYCEKKKIKLCSIKDYDYPEILKSTSNAPILLYYKGELLSEEIRVAMVGTRKPSHYGLRVATQLAEELAGNGITIVSGAAVGIDTASHKGAMRYGRTIAILGEGLEAVVAKDKRKFLEQIAEKGAVISEYSPNAHSSKGMFPQRNRIIAGLSMGVVIVEAGESSGAMNTAQHAGDYGRLLFAVPGNINSEKSKGCHELIRDGAILIRSARDIIEDCKFNIDYHFIPEYDFNEQSNQNNQPKLSKKSKTKISKIPKAKIIGLPPLEGNEDLVFQAISDDRGISAEEIMMKVDNIESSEISSILLNLEMNGYIEEDEIGNYIRIYGNY